jgi:hypothetical protein
MALCFHLFPPPHHSIFVPSLHFSISLFLPPWFYLSFSLLLPPLCILVALHRIFLFLHTSSIFFFTVFFPSPSNSILLPSFFPLLPSSFLFSLLLLFFVPFFSVFPISSGISSFSMTITFLCFSFFLYLFLVTFLNFPFLNTHNNICSIFFHLPFCLFLYPRLPAFSNKNKIWTAHQYKLLSPVLASSDFIKKYLHFINFAEVPSCVFMLLSYSAILIIFRQCCCFFPMGQCREIFARQYFANEAFILFSAFHSFWIL